MKKAIVHVRCNASGKVQRVKRDGRDTIILPSYAAKAESVLNGILYPRAELDDALSGLDRKPAPLGHPMLNNRFVPALDPEALARNHVFAWNENPRWDGDRVALDVVIDEARAKESEDGKRLLNAIEARSPISTSTGLMCNLEQANAEGHKSIARNIEWDHVAILLDEDPAISPEQGVGIFVNAANGGQEIQVVNSVIDDDADRELGWAVESAVRALEKKARAPFYERITRTLIEALSGSEREQPSEQQNKDADMTVSKEQFDALSGEVKTLSEGVTNIGTTIAEAVANAVKPLIDAQTEITANAKAKDEAELTELVGKIVKANILTEADAKELTLNAARALAKKAEPGKAAALNAAFGGANADDEFTGVDLNAALEVK